MTIGVIIIIINPYLGINSSLTIRKTEERKKNLKKANESIESAEGIFDRKLD